MMGLVRLRVCLTFSLLLSVLTGCGSVGMMVSPTKTYSGYETISLARTVPDYLNKAADVGTSLGYSVSRLNRSEHSIGFSKDAGLFVGVMIGKIERADVGLTFKNNGAVVEIEVHVMGNFDRGGQDTATTILNEFKSRLTRMLSA